MSRHCHVSATSCDATDPHALVTVVSLVVLCEASDVGTEHPSPLQRRARPSRLILFDRRAGGVGITTAAYAHARRLLARPAISCHTLIIQTPTATPTAPRPAIPCRTPANTISIIVRVTVNISEKTNAGEHDESWKSFAKFGPKIQDRSPTMNVVTQARDGAGAHRGLSLQLRLPLLRVGHAVRLLWLYRALTATHFPLASWSTTSPHSFIER